MGAVGHGKRYTRGGLKKQQRAKFYMDLDYRRRGIRVIKEGLKMQDESLAKVEATVTFTLLD